MVLEVIKTADGSDTVFREDLNQHYHSTFGALQESEYIFISTGLITAIDKFREAGGGLTKPLNILEIGFGTGLNALLACMLSGKQGLRVDYTAIEPFPLDRGLTDRLNYDRMVTQGDEGAIFGKLHLADWNSPVEISPHFTLHKIREKLQEYQPPANRFHLVFFDAFGPDAQPELWTEQIFRTLGLGMIPGGILVTYSVKGIVVRAFRSAGFQTEKLPGPPGKRHILRATWTER
ncbi:MAG: tRNA (5-methylaminomethyl-2-thiouridine)(34)-methyltransferase MnmD [Bacteroidota bacterium]